MFKTLLTYIEAVVVIVAVGVSLHYLAGLDWPWAILIGAAVSVALRWLIHSGAVARMRKRLMTGDGATID
jgi:NhaP-type Na+/H+ or K+/H+ antiporter